MYEDAKENGKIVQRMYSSRKLSDRQAIGYIYRKLCESGSFMARGVKRALEDITGFLQRKKQYYAQ